MSSRYILRSNLILFYWFLHFWLTQRLQRQGVHIELRGELQENHEIYKVEWVINCENEKEMWAVQNHIEKVTFDTSSTQSELWHYQGREWALILAVQSVNFDNSGRETLVPGTKFLVL